MTAALHEQFPDRYERCDRCRGTGTIGCRWCEGHGNVVGPDYYLYAGGLGRRFGLKRCASCRGSGKQSCGLCSSGSVPRT